MAPFVWRLCCTELFELMLYVCDADVGVFLVGRRSVTASSPTVTPDFNKGYLRLAGARVDIHVL